MFNHDINQLTVARYFIYFDAHAVELGFQGEVCCSS